MKARTVGKVFEGKTFNSSKKNKKKKKRKEEK